MADPASKPPGANIEYADVPHLMEVFADSIHALSFDGQTLRINFCATRMGEGSSAGVPNAKRYPTCRLVLSAGGAVDLINKMQQVSAALMRAGVLKAESAPPAGKTN